jgi:hypothetical protein
MQPFCQLRIHPRHAVQTIPRHESANRHRCSKTNDQRQPHYDSDSRPHSRIHPRQRTSPLVQRQRNHRPADRPQHAQQRQHLHSLRHDRQHRRNRRHQGSATYRRLPLHRLWARRRDRSRRIYFRPTYLLVMILKINLRSSTMRAERRNLLTRWQVPTATMTKPMHTLKLSHPAEPGKLQPTAVYCVCLPSLSPIVKCPGRSRATSPNFVPLPSGSTATIC